MHLLYSLLICSSRRFLMMFGHFTCLNLSSMRYCLFYSDASQDVFLVMLGHFSSSLLSSMPYCLLHSILLQPHYSTEPFSLPNRLCPTCQDSTCILMTFPRSSEYLFYPSCPLNLSPISRVRWVPLSRTICQYYLPYSAVGTIHKEVLKYILLYCLLTWSFNHARTSSCTLYDKFRTKPQLSVTWLRQSRLYVYVFIYISSLVIASLSHG